jgi:hypothetical protein
MRNSFSASSWRLAILAGAALLSGCASYDGRGLQPGVSSADDVVALMGTPAMQWQDADGRRQLAYPRGPEGLQTYMAFIDTQGRLERIEGVLDTKHFARIEPGKSDQAAILRLLGPSQPQWTMRRDEPRVGQRQAAGHHFEDFLRPDRSACGSRPGLPTARSASGVGARRP